MGCVIACWAQEIVGAIGFDNFRAVNFVQNARTNFSSYCFRHWGILLLVPAPEGEARALGIDTDPEEEGGGHRRQAGMGRVQGLYAPLPTLTWGGG